MVFSFSRLLKCCSKRGRSSPCSVSQHGAVFAGGVHAGVHFLRFQGKARAVALHRLDDSLFQAANLLVFGVDPRLQPIAQVAFAVVAILHGQRAVARAPPASHALEQRERRPFALRWRASNTTSHSSASFIAPAAAVFEPRPLVLIRAQLAFDLDRAPASMAASCRCNVCKMSLPSSSARRSRSSRSISAASGRQSSSRKLSNTPQLGQLGLAVARLGSAADPPPRCAPSAACGGLPAAFCALSKASILRSFDQPSTYRERSPTAWRSSFSCRSPRP